MLLLIGWLSNGSLGKRRSICCEGLDEEFA